MFDGNFDNFYQAHRNEIGRALTFTLGQPSLALEAVDEAMARAFQKWPDISTYENPAGWVYRTALNWARSWRRSAFRRNRREEKVALSESGLLDTSIPDMHPELFSALSQLSLDQRSVVVLRYYCDWSVADTALALNISEGTVKSRTARGLSQLRAVVSPGERRAV